MEKYKTHMGIDYGYASPKIRIGSNGVYKPVPVWPYFLLWLVLGLVLSLGTIGGLFYGLYLLAT